MLPPMSTLHPPIVHMVIGLAIAGIILRLVSLLGWPKFVGPAATTLIIGAAIASIFAVDSGHAAHEAVEQIPGAGAAVRYHEEWGERTRDLLVVLAGVEILVALMGKREPGKWLRYGSAALGIVGLWFIYQTGAAGGDVVYGYAGGVAVRTQDTTDVGHLLMAGLYQRAMLDRKENNAQGAAATIQEMAQRFPNDAQVRLLLAESQLRDSKNPQAALATLEPLATDTAPFMAFRVGLVRADAYEAAGQPDAARAVIQGLMQRFPKDARLQARLKQMLQKIH